nr:hypothetical protein [uncultured Hyphomonas sp.]
MTIEQIHENIALNRELIAETWQFFVTVHLSLFGLLFLIDQRRVKWPVRFIMLAAYAGFMYLNYRAQLDNYNYSFELIRYGLKIETENSDESVLLLAVFEPGWVVRWLKWIYGVAAVLGAALILIPQNKARAGTE